MLTTAFPLVNVTFAEVAFSSRLTVVYIISAFTISSGNELIVQDCSATAVADERKLMSDSAEYAVIESPAESNIAVAQTMVINLLLLVI